MTAGGRGASPGAAGACGWPALLVVVGIGAGVAGRPPPESSRTGLDLLECGPAGARLFPGPRSFAFPRWGRLPPRPTGVRGRLVVSLEEIDFDALADILAQPAGDGTVEAFRGMAFEAARRARAFALRLIGLGLAGGAAGGAVLLALLKPRLAAVARAAGLAGLSGALALGLLAAWAWATFDPSAFRSPTYRGALASLPWVVDAGPTGGGPGGRSGERLRTLVAACTRCTSASRAPPAPGAGGGRRHHPAHHRHPQPSGRHGRGPGVLPGFLWTSPSTPAISPTWARALKPSSSEGCREFPVPHLFVTGNHETPEVAAALSLIEPVRLIDGQMVEASGVRILGIGDPAAAGAQCVRPDPRRGQDAGRGDQRGPGRYDGAPGHPRAPQPPGGVRDPPRTGAFGPFRPQPRAGRLVSAGEPPTSTPAPREERACEASKGRSRCASASR